MERDGSAQAYYRIASSLFSRARKYPWERCVRHVIPSLILAEHLRDLSDDGLPRRICYRAKTGVLKLVSAHSSYITPRGVNWFAYTPPTEISIDERDWYKRATQAVQKELETSNFYTVLIAATVDRVATGTGLMLAESNEHGLIFTHIPAGTYAIAENKDHEIDTVVRRFKMSAHQLVQEFGLESLTPEMRVAYQEKDRRYAEDFEIWHLTMPRDVASRGNKDKYMSPLDMDYLQVYIDAGGRKVLKEDGYPEFPYFCTRYLKYGHQVWGESALAPIVDLIEDYILVEDSLKTIVQAQAYPRVLSPANLADELDLRAGGITVLAPENYNTNSLPREWASSGNYSAGKELLEIYNDAIDDTLHIDTLQNVSQIERQMTATEAQIREREKLLTLGETFTQYSVDMRPLMNRVFCLALRLGIIEETGMPQELLDVTGTGGIKVLAPGVSYIGRLAKMLESNKQQGLQEAVSYAVQMAQATQNIEWMDFVKPYETMQFLTDESNVPAECLRKPQEARAVKEQREQAQMAQMAAQMQAQDAAAARDYASAANA